MVVLANFGFFAVFQSRHPMPSNDDIDCEIRFHGLVRSLRVLARLSLPVPEIITTVDFASGVRLETSVANMKSFNMLLDRIGEQVKGLTIDSRGNSGNIDSGIDIVGEDRSTTTD
jgi:hypothetical protein